MLFNTTTQGNLLAKLSARRTRQHNLCHVSLDTHDTTTGTGASNVHHQDFSLCEFLDLCPVARAGASLDAEQLAQQEIIDLELCVNLGQLSHGAEDVADKSVGTAQRRVNLCAYAWDGVW